MFQGSDPYISHVTPHIIIRHDFSDICRILDWVFYGLPSIVFIPSAAGMSRGSGSFVVYLAMFNLRYCFYYIIIVLFISCTASTEMQVIT